MKCGIILLAYLQLATITHAAIIRSGETHDVRFEGYHIDPPSVPFKLPNAEKSKTPAVVAVSIPPPTKVEQNFVHQELGSLQKPSRKGAVKRLKLNKNEDTKSSCTDRDVATVVAERVKNRPRPRLRHPYTQKVTSSDYFLRGPDDNTLKEQPDPEPKPLPVSVTGYIIEPPSIPFVY